jgi:hypothetical protein
VLSILDIAIRQLPRLPVVAQHRIADYLICIPPRSPRLCGEMEIKVFLHPAGMR